MPLPIEIIAWVCIAIGVILTFSAVFFISIAIVDRASSLDRISKEKNDDTFKGEGDDNIQP